MRKVLAIVLIGITTFATSAKAGVPQLINYQGFLTTSLGDPVNATVDLTFTIYDAPGGGNVIWTETQVGVSVSAGDLSTLLGSVQPLVDTVFNADARYLGVKIGTDPEITPRTQIVSVGYSLRVGTVDGASGGILQSDLFIGNGSGDTLVKVGAGADGGGSVTLSPSTSLARGKSAPAGASISISSEGIMFLDSAFDTTLCLFPNGNIMSNGQIAVGRNSVGSGAFSTVLGFGNTASGDSSTVTGGYSNTATGRVSTIGGGALNETGPRATVAGGVLCRAFGGWDAIGGGSGNTAWDDVTTIAGGSENHAQGDGSSIGGGEFDTTLSNWAVVSGGLQNSAFGEASTICGGFNNKTNNSWATVIGGCGNEANETFSLAGGNNAKANHIGSFVWADSTDTTLVSSAKNEMTFRSTGGARIFTNKSLTSGVTIAAGASAWVTASDSALKENIEPVDGEEILNKIRQLPISEWNYLSQDESIRHIGPMAQDFHRLFGLGADDKHISTLDPDGVALAAIKALTLKLEEKSSDVETLSKRMDEMQKVIDKLSHNK